MREKVQYHPIDSHYLQIGTLFNNLYYQFRDFHYPFELESFIITLMTKEIEDVRR